MRTTLLATVSILSLGLAVPSFAATSDDAAYDKGSHPIGDSAGHCVRTKWQGDTDPCAIAPAPAPKTIVQPRPAAALVPAPVMSREARTVYFEFNKATLTASATSKLDQLAAIINKATAITEVTIHGFTDQIGTDSYNEALAHKRAAAVKTYLDGHSRLKATEGDVRGLGKASPEEQCQSVKKRTARIECMSKERRVEVEFKAQQ
ncbi:MAG: OmpA family protein [Rickettsiales bacterium]